MLFPAQSIGVEIPDCWLLCLALRRPAKSVETLYLETCLKTWLSLSVSKHVPMPESYRICISSGTVTALKYGQVSETFSEPELGNSSLVQPD